MIVQTSCDIYFAGCFYKKFKDNSKYAKFKFMDVITVPIEDLPDISSTEVICRCEECGKDRKVRYHKAKSSINYNNKTLCKLCSKIGKNNPRYKHGSAKFSSYIARAKAKHIHFSLDISLFNLIINRPCIYCGSVHKLFTNGIDRIDPKIGYVEENCSPCCWICNKMKSDMTDIEFKNHIKGIYSHLEIKVE